MKTRMLLLGMSSCALMIATATVQAQGFGMHFATPMPTVQEPQAPPAQTAPDQTTPNPDQAKATTFTGTIVKDGENYVLRDSSGGIYKLDDSDNPASLREQVLNVAETSEMTQLFAYVDLLNERYQRLT